MMMMKDDTCPSWKLYENPFYISPSHRQTPHKSAINKHLQFYCLKLASSSSFCDLVPTKKRMDSELDLARSHIVELKTELRYERKARKKLESLAKRLAKELDEERKQREAMELLCQQLSREVSLHETKIDLMKKKIEDERKMLRLSEVLREERVQMKLAEVKIVFEDMLSEIESGKLKPTAADNSSASSINNNAVGDGSSPAESTALDAVVGEQRLSCKMEIPAVAAPTSGSPEVENINPHIVRGIKGFVEFRRVVRTKGSKSRDSDAKLECQKAQLRVLLKQKEGSVRSNNLFIT
ncbi:Protein BRANCHLESS TRICHOME [Cucurbita argyrosperma subsp. argyrosperma]|nr:Protein BRANCHLESS TRICHOME [Cucurbita argyrosperma subsp. argyrosperma]